MSRLPVPGDLVQITVGGRPVTGTVVSCVDGWCRVVTPGADPPASDSRILPFGWHDRMVESVTLVER